MRRRALKYLRERWIVAACLLPCQGIVCQTLHSSQHPMYVNRVFEYQVTLPPGVTYSRTQPPSPDHGLGVDLSGATKLWTDASYSDFAKTDDEVKRQTDGCVVEEDKVLSLGSRPARSLLFSCPANSYGGAYREHVVMTVLRGRERAPICYQVALRTSAERTDPAGDELFRKLVAGFRFARR